MSEPRTTEQAESNLEDSREYTAQRGEAAADRLLDGILQRPRVHAQFPLMGRPREDLGPNLRSFVVSPFVVFYRPSADTIEVLRVLHGSRDVDTIIMKQQ